MDFINFPSQYKNAVLNQTKNTTIRVKNEIGKYKTGHTYVAQSYAGTDWGQKIKVTRIIQTKFKNLSEYGIPLKTITAIRQKEKISPEASIEIINFKYL